jgi:prepilin-type N-terminal cleavage/methylation domain-containing protein
MSPHPGKNSAKPFQRAGFRPPKNFRGPRTGFTLIELLVVISIIALMLAILLPTIGRAREQARRAICASNMRQTYLGMETYAGDAREYYPGILGLGQNTHHGDSSYTAAYMGPGWPAGNTAPQWMRDANNAVPHYIGKGATKCPSTYKSPAQDEWQTVDYGGGVTLKWGFTDFSIKAGFGSNHGGIGDSGYQEPTPGPPTAGGGWPGGGNYNTFRGYLEWRFPRKGYGYFLNFRRNQYNPVAPYRKQQLNSIMIMDRQRSPAFVSTDATPYKMEWGNHNIGGSPGSEGSNIVQLDGRVRWMDLSKVWQKDPTPGPYGISWDSNYYDISGYAEGMYHQYVDDEIARGWAS